MCIRDRKVTLPDEVLLVEMDGRLIIQVLVNMIDNAIKHTPDATMIDIRCYKDHGWAVFEVIDQGEGKMCIRDRSGMEG